MDYKKITCIAMLGFSVSAVSLRAEEELSKHLTTIVNAKVIQREEPRYPASAAKRGQEGWAKANFVVEPDGSVSNIIVVDSMGDRKFEKAAILAMKKWKYSPATENGEAIQQCKNSVMLQFVMSSQKGAVTRPFLKEYKAALQAYDNKDADELKSKIDEIANRRNLLISESTYLTILRFHYAKLQGDKDQQLFRLYQLNLPNDSLEENHQLSFLRETFVLEIEANKLASALSTYDEIKKLPAAEPYMPSFNNIKNKIINSINSDKNIVTKGTIPKRNFWRHAIARNSFSLMNIQGEVNKLDVRCNNKRHQFTVVEGSTWEVPTQWQNCRVFVFGDENTTFDFVELPKASEQVVTASN